MYSGEVGTMERIEDYLEVEDLAFFKYVPIKSAYIDRSISYYKYVLSDNKCNYIFDQIKKIVESRRNAFIVK